MLQTQTLRQNAWSKARPKQQSTIQFLKQLTLMLAMRLGLQIFKTFAKTAVLLRRGCPARDRIIRAGSAGKCMFGKSYERYVSLRCSLNC